ncbi:hypothetical protein IC582_009322 [Cucumis melo]
MKGCDTGKHEFERKRNKPERYDRNFAEEPLKAIKKIDKVIAIRESRHIAWRMRGKKAKGLEEDLKEDRSLTLPKIKVKVVPSQGEHNQPMEE